VNVRFEDEEVERRPAPFRWPELPVLDTVLGDVLEGPEVDSDETHLLSERQYAKLQGSPDWRRDPTHRLARLDGCARTLIAGYRSGHAGRSEFVHRPGSPRPRFYTLTECQRLQGFPADFVLSNGGNEGRGFHQLGNAVCPILVAAIAGNVLAALGIVAAPPPPPLGFELAAAAGSRAWCAPALQVLLRAAPTPAAPRGDRGSLAARCAAFLRAEPGAPTACCGWGPRFEPADASVLRAHLRSALPLARVLGLHELGRVLHFDDESGSSFDDDSGGSACATIVAAGVVPALAACLQSADEEVRRLAVVAVCCASRTAAGLSALATCAAVGENLAVLARGLGEDSNPDDVGAGGVKAGGSARGVGVTVVATGEAQEEKHVPERIVGGFRTEAASCRLVRQASEALANLGSGVRL
jgi:hypothetical protein